MTDLISVAVWTAAVFALGYGYRAELEQNRMRQLLRQRINDLKGSGDDQS